MSGFLKILGDGQVWDVRGISPEAPCETFEDLFSGRALGRMAQQRNIFSSFKDKGKVTGFSVTKALLSNNKEAKKAARLLIEGLAENGARGIAALNNGKGLKKNWSSRERSYWKGLDFVIIGGGVSEDLTGRILVNSIKKYLSREKLFDIEVLQAKFPGKEAGFMGAVINTIEDVCRRANKKRLRTIGAIGLDLGREDIGVGLLAVDAVSKKLLKQKNNYWLFKYSVRTPYKKYLKNFMDSRQDYTAGEYKLGERIRHAILNRMAGLVIQARKRACSMGLACADRVGVAVPGSTSPDGYIINSTDYLPFFRKQDGFNFARNLEASLAEKKAGECHIHIINDGIAAGIANIYFDVSRVRDMRGKFAFLGVGSGLGGCLGVV
ncbi:MAG: hypothetical protein PHW54_00820 [Candidatus Omnitrophica bacterium]|nr:hypothetical protein [Candidatus Omnitrophota bacterium]